MLPFAASEINEATLRQLHRCEFLNEAHNVVLIGGPGTGKTHAVTALGVQAIEEAGQAAGGDKRGRQSAALKVYNVELYPWLDLRVDEHRNPVQELRRVFGVAQGQLLPFVDGMPKRNDPLGGIPAEVTAMLMTPPPYRPGGNGGA